MKRLILIIGVLLIGGTVKAAPPGQTYSATRTSFSATAQGVALFSSATIQFMAVNVSSGSSTAGSSKLVLYRSTSSSFALDVSSQTTVYTGFNSNVVGNQTVPLWDMTNSSYTYVEKIGASETTIFFRCLGPTGVGNCPGLIFNAQK